jgi:hypothetical protein
MAGEGGRHDRHQGEGHQGRRLENLAAWAPAQVTHQETDIGQVHCREADGQLPPGRGADEVIGIELTVVGVAVVLNMDERERLE